MEGDDVHVFYLQAPRGLRDPDARHHHATIGHSVSRDLPWEVLPDAVGPSSPGAFDDLATWTGSVVRAMGAGISSTPAFKRRERRRSADRLGRLRGPRHMLVTARGTNGPHDARGVIGHVVSHDLPTWEAGPLLTEPGELSKLEVPQLVHLGGAWRIRFCTDSDCHAAPRLDRRGVVAQCGTHYLSGDAKYGRYALATDDFLVGDPVGRHYAGRVLQHRGAWHFLAWRLYDEHDEFIGELGDPMPLRIREDGSLSVERSPG
jgi:beta-fructofuranosidase